MLIFIYGTSLRKDPKKTIIEYNSIFSRKIYKFHEYINNVIQVYIYTYISTIFTITFTKVLSCTVIYKDFFLDHILSFNYHPPRYEELRRWTEHWTRTETLLFKYIYIWRLIKDY